jgi:hypothetical protein
MTITRAGALATRAQTGGPDCALTPKRTDSDWSFQLASDI